MHTNFTAKYLGILGNTITDNNGISIETLKTVKDKKFFFEYSKPKIICDVLLKSKPLLEPEIRSIRFEDLIRMGFCIVSIKKKIRYGGSVIYKIIKRMRIPMNASVLERIPQNHSVDHDLSNNRIRLIGKNASPLEMGEWIYIENE